MKGRLQTLFPLRFSDTAFEEHPEIYNVQGTGTASKITSNAFEHLPLVFLDTEPETPTDYIQIYGRSNNKRVYRWIDKRYVLPTDNYLETYNVFVPEANGSGAIGEVLSTPVIGVPVNSSLEGMDALLSTVQMPPGIPVATVGIDGAANAAILAAEILAVSDEKLAQLLLKKRIEAKEAVLEKNHRIEEKWNGGTK